MERGGVQGGEDVCNFSLLLTKKLFGTSLPVISFLNIRFSMSYNSHTIEFVLLSCKFSSF